jgi:hypothetical protein
VVGINGAKGAELEAVDEGEDGGAAGGEIAAGEKLIEVESPGGR